jgi:hypothetical protein
MVKIVVVRQYGNECIIGFIHPQIPTKGYYRVEVLHASVLKGANYASQAIEPICTHESEFRLATVKDLDDFNIAPNQYENRPAEYEMIR